MSETLVHTIGKAKLGDRRLTVRAQTITSKAALAPGASFPDAMGSDAALEALYRFLGNSDVSHEMLLEPHFAATAAALGACETPIIAHDTTEFRFLGKSKRKGLGRLQQQGQGFFGHFALALAFGKVARPLGVVGLETLFRTNPSQGKRTPAQHRKNPNNESLRWARLAKNVEGRLGPAVRPIHVMDREADSYDLFQQFCSAGWRFIIRAAHNRAVAGEVPNLRVRDVLGSEVLLHREVPVSPRQPRGEKQRRIHPTRDARMAKLGVSAQSIELKRPKHALTSTIAMLQINVVHVHEVDGVEGVDPIEWILWTTEPIDTIAAVERIVDAYRSRWLIEEFFKALKTGCSYEQRQLESSHSLLNALGIYVPIAVQLLDLRWMSRGASADLPATQVLAPSLIQPLLVLSEGKLKPNPTIKQAMLAIAALGGHIKNNGAPGWLVLWRGLQKLLAFAQGWDAGQQAMIRNQLEPDPGFGSQGTDL